MLEDVLLGDEAHVVRRACERGVLAVGPSHSAAKQVRTRVRKEKQYYHYKTSTISTSDSSADINPNLRDESKTVQFFM